MRVVPHQIPPHGGAIHHAASRDGRSNAGLIAFLLAYPLLIPAAFYATWLVGRLALGDWPQPGIDDPKQLGGATVFAHGATLSLVMLGFPLFAIGIGVACHGAVRDRDNRRCLACAAVAGTLLLVAGVVFLLFDPNGVAGWFFD